MSSGRLHLPALLLATACGAATGCADKDLGSDDGLDLRAPRIAVSSPARGTIVGDVSTVTVTGVVTDDDDQVASVTVNGVAAEVTATGAFTAEVPVGAGVALLAVTATDAAGNHATDTRAVLAGPTAPIDDPVPDAVVMGISDDTFVALGDVAAAWLTHGDLAPTLAPAGPLFEVGYSGPDDCLYARGRAGAMTVDGAAIDLFTRPGGLSLGATLTDVAVTLDLEYAAACLDGDTAITAHIGRLDLQGDLDVGIEDNRIAIALTSTNLDLAGLDVSFADIPVEVSDLVDLDTTLGPILSYAVERLLAPMIADALGDPGAPIELDVLGKHVTLELLPVQLDFDDDGAQVRIDTRVSTEGDDGASFVFVPNVVPGLAVEEGFVAALADDAMTQVMASFWAAGGLRYQLPLGGGAYGSIGVLFDEVRLEGLLPPTVNAHHDDGRLQVVFGDLLATFLAEGVPVTQVAINGAVDLAAERTEAGLRLGVGVPAVTIDVLDEVAGTNALDAETFEALLSFAAGRVVGMASDLVGELPLPAMDGVGSLELQVASTDGYVLLAGDVVR
ncbi:MAG: hypothetical protein R2939_09755 [Kofleriaceae bacterium]